MLTKFAKCLFALTLFVTVAIAGDEPQFPGPEPEHAFLNKFVGEWESTGECPMGPDQPVMNCEGKIKGRMLGEMWMVADFENSMGDSKMSAILTIGYDPQQKHYVGTWVDSMTNYMWKYEGSVDKSGKVLTLRAEGPNMMEEGKLAKYEDIYTFTSADAWGITSRMQGQDGEWVTYMSATAKRKTAK